MNIEKGFYLEAITIEESIFADRLMSFIHAWRKPGSETILYSYLTANTKNTMEIMNKMHILTPIYSTQWT